MHPATPCVRAIATLALLAATACRTRDASPRRPAAPAPDSDCPAAIHSHLAERERANHCTSDDDCRAIWPGLCPHGPHYVHHEAEAAMRQSIQGMYGRCRAMIPQCEPPPALPPPRCADGRCVPSPR